MNTVLSLPSYNAFFAIIICDNGLFFFFILFKLKKDSDIHSETECY